MKKDLLKRIALTACFMGTLWSVAHAETGRLILPEHAGGAVAWVSDGPVKRAPSEVLQVFVGEADACCAGKAPIAGHYRLDGARVTFDPAFDFIEGQSYTVLSPGDGAGVGADADLAPTLTAFNLAQNDTGAAPEILAIYPSGPDIPENTLRFYIDFATPMTPHVSMDFIRLVDATGTPDTAAFMAFKQELWNEDRTRLTLLMDPGRIKRGVATNVDLGPALVAGKRYAIKVLDGWHAAQGNRQAPGFDHAFTATPALRTRPDTALWQVQAPRQATRDPLRITFDRPFDRQMAQHAITVVDASGQVIPGVVSVEDAERAWQFTPRDAWTAQSLFIVVDATLEDVAGNNLRALLDHALGTEDRAIDHQTIPLTLAPAPD